MLEFIRDAGFGIFPVMAFGAVALLVSLRYTVRPERRFVPLVVGFSITTLIAGAIGTITGMQTTFKYLAMQHSADGVILLEGLKESLNNIVAACTIVAIVAIVTTIGAYRAVDREESALFT